MAETPTTISNATLTTAALTEVGLTESVITDATFSDCDLRQKDFEGAQLTRATFFNCDASRASFRFARFVDCEFDIVPASFASFEGATFSGCTFRYLDLSRANLRSSTFENCHFSGVGVDHADFSVATFTACDFESPTTENADGMLYAMGGECTNFSGATFRTMKSDSGNPFRVACDLAVFRRATFQDLTWRRASFPNADFSHAAFENVDLCGAELENAKFQAADLQNVSFADANLFSADFTRPTSVPPPDPRALFFLPAPEEPSSLRNVSFTGANLNVAEFTGTVLEECTLDNADATGADFSATTLLSCSLTETDLSGASPGAEETPDSARRTLFQWFADCGLALPYTPFDDAYDFRVRAPWLVHSLSWDGESPGDMADPERLLTTSTTSPDEGFSVAVIDYENGAVTRIASYAYVGWQLSIAIRLCDGARTSPLPLPRAWGQAMRSVVELALAASRSNRTRIDVVYDETEMSARWSIISSGAPAQTVRWHGDFADISGFFGAATNALLR
ncbi:pentapeptide repeat-containing protein [Microbacterium sp. NPDC088619]|uniref:pentapeptide repeat-containing protein n=1 Tax=Microbacterium sp. NPDC088619 TaxID=3364196 RepID=UPI0037FD2AB4